MFISFSFIGLAINKSLCVHKKNQRISLVGLARGVRDLSPAVSLTFALSPQQDLDNMVEVLVHSFQFSTEIEGLYNLHSIGNRFESAMIHCPDPPG
jgi:hypothetical protein